MNSKQTNKLNMYLAAQGVLHKYEAAWQPLPAFVDGVDELNENIATIQSLAQTQLDKNGGAAEKAQATAVLADAAFEVAAAVHAFAVTNGNRELAAQMKYTRSEIIRGRDSNVLARCQSIQNAAATTLAALAGYGITPARLTAFKKKIDAFALAQSKPRHGLTTRSAATKQLEKLFVSTDEVLNERLDGLAVQFRESQPAFYNEYVGSRVIVDHHGRSSKDPATPATPTPHASTATDGLAKAA